LQFTPFKQPRLLKACAHGLHKPRWWHDEPTVGLSAEPKTKASGTAVSRLNKKRGFGHMECANKGLPSSSCTVNATVLTPIVVSKAAVLQQLDSPASEPDASVSGAATPSTVVTASGGTNIGSSSRCAGFSVVHGNNAPHTDADRFWLPSLNMASSWTPGLGLGICCVTPMGSVAKRGCMQLMCRQRYKNKWQCTRQCC